MIRLKAMPLNTLDDARLRLQTAIELEFSTLPPYLYAKFSIPADTNAKAAAYIGDIVGQEMIHMCLACNILNALGGTPLLVSPHSTPPFPLVYPSTLPGDIGPPGKDPIVVGLLPFSKDAMAQGMAIELPEEVLPITETLLASTDDGTETIGQFYRNLDAFLATLPDSDWQPERNQIDDSQFFQGQLFAVNNYADASRAIGQIVSEGEGSAKSPLDFQDEPSHYYRFGEMWRNQVLTKADTPTGYQWGPEPFGVQFPDPQTVIANPSTRDFEHDPPDAKAAQDACNRAFTQLVDCLQKAVNGEAEQLGIAVRAMFELRQAAIVALATPLADGTFAGPSFLYMPIKSGASS